MTEPAHAWGLLIHVGPWKTGTKTVQSGLASMSAMLAAHQIVSPAGGKNPGAQHTFANAMRRICTGSRTSSGHVYTGTDELCGLANGCYTISVSEGSYPSEVSWEITQVGVLMAEGSAGETVGGVCNDYTTSPTMTMVPTIVATIGNSLSLSHFRSRTAHSLARVLAFAACMHGYNGSHRWSPSLTPMPSHPPPSDPTITLPSLDRTR